MKNRYAKSVCLSALYITLVTLIYLGISRLFSKDISVDGLIMTLSASTILLHFMDKEDKEENECQNSNDM